jgi:hypothetical protein
MEEVSESDASGSEFAWTALFGALDVGSRWLFRLIDVLLPE